LLKQKQTMSYTDFIYSQYTIQELTEIIAGNKYNGSYLDSHAKRCGLEIIKRHHAEQETLTLN
jgi:hypothetical protein